MRIDSGSRSRIWTTPDGYEYATQIVSRKMFMNSSLRFLLAALGILIWCQVALPQAAAPQAQQNQNPSNVRSKISIYDLESKSIRAVYTADTLWEAPNWSPDGKYLLANSGGVLYRIAVDANGKAQPEKLSLDAAYQCNNDHGVTRDGKLLAFSAKYNSPDSQVFVASSDGTKPRLLTPNSPSYFHGWSPDGKWLAFVGKRGDYFNIFRVSVDGGNEQRLTSSAVSDDGPDYSPDGKWIYINSNRSGTWDIWRFPPDGAGPGDSKAERITSDELEDWFPHPSPDGKWIVFLSFPKGTPGHNVKTNVQLRIIPMPNAAPGKSGAESIQSLAQIFGGQGTINVNSWSPDSKKFAFVSYEVLP
jgi:TolB protein